YRDRAAGGSIKHSRAEDIAVRGIESRTAEKNGGGMIGDGGRNRRLEGEATGVAALEGAAVKIDDNSSGRRKDAGPHLTNATVQIQESGVAHVGRSDTP